MNIFETVKTSISPLDAALHYGLAVSPCGMLRCPFHQDRHPSMKLYDDHYHCFACQETGDVITFTAKLFNLQAGEAAGKLAHDFGLSKAKLSTPNKLHHRQTQTAEERQYSNLLCEYLHILQNWMEQYSPRTPEDEPHPKFLEACRMLPYVEYVAEQLITGSAEERAAIMEDLRQNGQYSKLATYVRNIKEEEYERE